MRWEPQRNTHHHKDDIDTILNTNTETAIHTPREARLPRTQLRRQSTHVTCHRPAQSREPNAHLSGILSPYQSAHVRRNRPALRKEPGSRLSKAVSGPQGHVGEEDDAPIFPHLKAQAPLLHGDLSLTSRQPDNANEEEKALRFRD